MKIHVYAIRHPETLRCEYVGQTQNTNHRFNSHRKKFAHIPGVLLETIESLDCPQEATDRERYWIEHYWAKGEAKANKKLPRKAHLRVRKRDARFVIIPNDYTRPRPPAV